MNRYIPIATVATALLIAAGSAPAAESFFDVFTELTTGPPYPTEPVEVMVMHEKEPGMPELGMVQTEIIGVGVRVVDNNDPPRGIRAYDSGGAGGPGVTSFFDVFTELSTSEYPADSFFDLFIEISPPEPGGEIMTRRREADHVGSFFDVFFDVTVGGGLESLHLHGEIGPGQPLSFADVHIPTFAESFFDVFVALHSSAPVIRESPLFTMTMTGTYVPEPAALSLLSLGASLWLASRKRRKN